jgi:MYXO-CTERM domain-containing protein
MPPECVLAAPITRTFDFVANNIVDETANNVAPPVNPVVGSVTVTFDPTLGGFVNRTIGITVNSLNVVVASPIAFSFNPVNTDEIQIGGLDQGTNGLTDGVSDFLVDIFDASDATPFFGNLDYTIAANSVATGQFSDFGPASRADGTVTTTTAVAEPPSVALWLAGLLLYGAIIRRARGESEAPETRSHADRSASARTRFGWPSLSAACF